MSAFDSLRGRFTGRASVRLDCVPPWAERPSEGRFEGTNAQSTLDALSAGQMFLLRRIMSEWLSGDFAQVNRYLHGCAAYFDPNKPHLLACFVGLGGVDLFVTLLCDVSVPKDTANNVPQSPPRTNPRTMTPFHLIRAIELMLRVLTELLVCHNELGWYYYDRYPGFFFRLLELANVPDLRLVSLMMLEHLLLCVGPVLEISKVPALQRLIRAEDDAVLAITCRVVSLLIVPGVVLDQRDSAPHSLLFPETLLPLQRIQRVIDSNVLWLIGVKGLVKRLVALCEVSELSNFQTAPSGGSFSSTLAGYALPVSLLSEPGRVALGGTGGLDVSDRSDFFLDDASASQFYTTDESAANRGREYAGGAALNSVGSLAALPPDVVDTFRAYLQPILGESTALLPDVEALSDVSAETAGSGIDFSWFVGRVDAKQRWRLRDLTLCEELDDNRALLCGFGPPSDEEAKKNFEEKSRAFWSFLIPVMQVPHTSHSRHAIVSAQSEVIFVLNVMLSTFYVGDVWRIMKECNWIEVASKFYDRSFQHRDGGQVVSPYLEQWQQARELRLLPRFLAPGGEHRGTGTPLEQATGNNGCVTTRCDDIAGEISGGADGSSNSGSDSDSDCERGRLFHGIRPWEDKEAYRRPNGSQVDVDDDEGADEKTHHHEADTIRKLELLRGILEFLNTQDRFECCMLQESIIVNQSAPLASKVAKMLANRSEDSCVETTACHTLEGYLRCFSFGSVSRTSSDAPQTVVGNILLRSILEHRVYNATFVPGLSDSLTPSKRVESVFSLLGELIRYHYGNLKLLQDYVVGSVELSHLNSPTATVSSHARQLHVGSEHLEQLIRLPPLDREEHEPFARVLLRRLRAHCCDSNLFVRSLLLSLTPGLRSKMNYMWKTITSSTPDAGELLNTSSRIGDIVTCYPHRFSYITACSRGFVVLISETQRMSNVVKMSTSALYPLQALKGVASPHLAPTKDLTLWDMLQLLLRSPHRFPLEERPFPVFFDDMDRAIVMGEMDLPPVGPPSHLVQPLFEDDSHHRSLAELEGTLLQEPHELVYGMLGPLNAERIHGTGRLCVVTTCILIFARVARLGGADAIHDVFERLKPLAQVGYEKWRKQRDVPARCSRVRESGSRRDGKRRTSSWRAPAGSYRSCAAQDESSRCSTYVFHGHCVPLGAAELYYRRYGGCFFRNMFRLLCFWVGHYGACQRYVETLFYCTEVPFAELKSVMLYLFRVLPDYFTLETA